MPVRGLTDKPRRIPRLGKVRLGDRSGRNGAPVNKPFFVVPEEVQAIYGAEPTELKIVFLSDDEEVIASSYYRAYNASNGLVCKGDGFDAAASLDADQLQKTGGSMDGISVWAHGKTGDRESATTNVVRQQIKCHGAGYEGQPPCPMFALKKCSVRSFFQFAIYGVPGLGVYQMDTGSVVNVDRILGVLELARTLTGGVAGVPMILSRVKTDVAPDGIKKGVWTVELKVDTQFSLTEVLKLRAGPVANALLPPVDESEVYDLPALPEGREDEDETDRGPIDPADLPWDALITEEQKVSINEWSEAIKGQAYARQKTQYLDETRRARWPEVVVTESNKWESSRLRTDEADAYIALLRSVHENGVPTATEPVAAGLGI